MGLGIPINNFGRSVHIGSSYRFRTYTVAVKVRCATVTQRNNKLVGKVGFEPTQPKATDLQSAVTLQLHRLPLIEPPKGIEPSTL
jgi:hypothetical protein